MCQKMAEGGLSMINVDDLQKYVLLSWGEKMIDKDEKYIKKIQLK